MIYLLSMFILSFLFNQPIYLVILFLCILIWASFAQSLKDVLNFMKYSLIISLFLFLLNTFFNQRGNTVLFSIPLKIFSDGVYSITLESILSSFISILRLFFVFAVFSLFNIIINPDELMRSMLKLRIPHNLTMIITISLQYFPILIKDLDQIQEIQQTQGVELHKGNFLLRLKNGVTLMLPLLTNSLERSIQVAEALDSRAFGVKKERTIYQNIKFTVLDYLFLIFLLLYNGINIYFFSLGYGEFLIYPTVSSFSFELHDFTFIIFNICMNLFLMGLLYIQRGYSDK
jgi:energy-coupling factor transport system permease protein